MSEEPRDYGDWIRRYDAVTGLGYPGITYLMRDPREPGVDIQQNPAWLLFRAIDGAMKKGTGQASWTPLMHGQAGRGAAISRPTDIYLAQGVLMEHKSQPKSPPMGLDPEGSTIVMMTSQSAGEALMDSLDEKNSDGTWKWADITHIDGGAFIDLHQEGTPDFTGQGQQQQQQAGPMLGVGAATVGNAGRGRGGGSGFSRYECTLRTDYHQTPAVLTAAAEIVYAKIKPFDEIIRVPTIEEQVRYICNAGLPASAVVYALQDMYGEFIPETVYEQARAETTRGQVAVTAAPAQGAVVPAPPGPTLAPGVPATGQMLGVPTGTPTPPLQTPPPPSAALGQPAPPVPTQQAPMLGAPPVVAPAAAPLAAPQVPMLGASPVPPMATPQQSAAVVPQATAPTVLQPAAPQGQPEAPPFDPQPTHADPATAQATADALAQARERARQV